MKLAIHNETGVKYAVKVINKKMMEGELVVKVSGFSE